MRLDGVYMSSWELQLLRRLEEGGRVGVRMRRMDAFSAPHGRIQCIVELASIGGLALLVRVCLRWFPALVSGCLYMPSHCVSLWRVHSGVDRQVELNR